jgi:hypothetical protein
MVKVSAGKCMRRFKQTLGILLIFCASNSFATTEYVVLERHTDIRIFEQYIDSLSTEKDPLAIVKLLTVEDAKWREIGKDNANTISKIKFVDGVGVVVANTRFGFEIHFKYKYEQGSLVWTCRIEDASIFFHPSECNGWEKRMTMQSSTKPLQAISK